MSRTMLIDATDSEETRVVVLNKSRLEEFDHESAARKQLKGNIYLAKVTRVEPSLQAAFVDYGGNRHGFLPFSEIHPDYYRIPIADREALKAEEAAIRDLGADDDEDEERQPRRGRRRSQGRSQDRSRGRSQARSRRRAVKSEAVEDASDAEDAAGSENETAAGESAADDTGEATEFEALAADMADEAEAGAEEAGEYGISAYGPGEYGADDEDDEDEDDDDEAADEAGEAREAAAESAAEADQDRDEDVEDEDGEDEDGGDEDEDDDGEAAAEAAQEAPATGRKANGADGGSGDLEEIEVESRVETVGGDEADDEARRRAIMARRYKIQEVIKRRQVLLVQVTKEERGNKGAALTTYLSLAGRYCVLMPNTNKGGGISRKIANVTDRRRLKKIIADLDIPDGMAVIVRTAGSERSKLEIRRDYEYLLRLWNEIRENTLQSNAPSLIHEEANLIKRSIRDLYARDMEEIVVAGEDGYKAAKAFMRSLMPSHAKKVQLHKEGEPPLLQKFGIERQLDEMHSSTVQLASGGYIVLNSTEALVAIDVNSGRATKERHIEETALKTNLEAASEVARQLRLRDLAGLIVIDFIDMEESRHNREVERRLKEAMRLDRARIQLGRISPFGLLELSRQRLRPSLFESSTVPCPTCEGRGYVRTTESAALHVLRVLEDEGLRRRGGEVMLTVPTSVGFYILNQKRERLLEIQQRHGFHIEVSADDSLVAPNYELSHAGGEALREERKRSDERRDSRRGGETRGQEARQDEQDDGRKRRRRRRPARPRDEEATAEQRVNGAGAAEAEAPVEDEAPDEEEREERQARGGSEEEREDGRQRSRRRRGRRGGRRRSRQRAEGAPETEAENGAAPEESAAGDDDGGARDETPDESETGEDAAVASAASGQDDEAEETGRKRRPRRTRRGGTRAKAAAAGAEDESETPAAAEAAAPEQDAGEATEEQPKAPAARRRRSRKPAAEAATEEPATEPAAAQPAPEPMPEPEPLPEPEPVAASPANGGERDTAAGGEDSPAVQSDAPTSGAESDDESGQKRRGWWSRLLQ